MKVNEVSLIFYVLKWNIFSLKLNGMFTIAYYICSDFTFRPLMFILYYRKVSPNSILFV